MILKLKQNPLINDTLVVKVNKNSGGDINTALFTHISPPLMSGSKFLLHNFFPKTNSPN